MLVGSLAIKRWKRLAHDARDTFATHANLVNDLIQTARHKDDGTAPSHVLASFKHQFFMNKTKPTSTGQALTGCVYAHHPPLAKPWHNECTHINLRWPSLDMMSERTSTSAGQAFTHWVYAHQPLQAKPWHDECTHTNLCRQSPDMLSVHTPTSAGKRLTKYSCAYQPHLPSKVLLKNVIFDSKVLVLLNNLKNPDSPWQRTALWATVVKLRSKHQKQGACEKPLHNKNWIHSALRSSLTVVLLNTEQLLHDSQAAAHTNYWHEAFTAVHVHLALIKGSN